MASNPVLGRLQQMQAAESAPAECEICGSTWFFIAECHQFSKARYSSTPGGDLSIVSATNPKIRICSCCLEPYMPNIGGVRPGRTAAGELDSFLGVLRRGKEMRAEMRKEIRTDAQLAQDFVARTEYENLLGKLNVLQAKFEELELVAAHPLQVVNVTAPAPDQEAPAPAAEASSNHVTSDPRTGRFQKKTKATE